MIDKKQTHCAGNQGNFLALMKLLSNHDDILQQHMEHPTMKNAMYVSPQTQNEKNEMIDVLGKRMIQASLVDEIKDARLYTICFFHCSLLILYFVFCILFVFFSYCCLLGVLN